MSTAEDVKKTAGVSVEGLEEEKEIGRGCNGVVYKVRLHGLPCIAKRLHDILVGRGREEQVNEEERLAITGRFHEECVLLSSLRHPNIVQFMGVHYGRDEADISLIMEYMHMDLDQCMKKYSNIPLPYKTSILRDVAYGLAYLHSIPIIHRDLNAGNVLLTESLRAKIADLGVAKLFDIEKAMEQKIRTRCPGALDFMPPESLSRSPSYDDKLDVFSFGHLTIYLVNQEAPYVEDLSILPRDAENQQRQVGKRRKSLDLMRGPLHPLYSIVVQCLSDFPDQRPTSRNLVRKMEELCKKQPLPYTGILQTLAQNQKQSREEFGRGEVESRQLLEESPTVAELVMENKRIREELEAMRRTVDANKKQKLNDDRKIQELHAKLLGKVEQNNELSTELAVHKNLSVKLTKEQSTSSSNVNFKTHLLKTKDREVEAKGCEIRKKDRQLAKKELELLELHKRHHTQLRRGASNSQIGNDDSDDEFVHGMSLY